MMNKTLLTLLLGAGAGYVIFKMLETEEGQEWKEKLMSILSEFGEEIKDRVLSEIEKFETTNAG